MSIRFVLVGLTSVFSLIKRTVPHICDVTSIIMKKRFSSFYWQIECMVLHQISSCFAGAGSDIILTEKQIIYIFLSLYSPYFAKMCNNLAIPNLAA